MKKRKGKSEQESNGRLKKLEERREISYDALKENFRCAAKMKEREEKKKSSSDLIFIFILFCFSFFF